MTSRLAVACVLLMACGGGDDEPGGDDGGDDGADIRPCGTEEPVHTGEATFYAADGSGNCSFEASPGDLRVAAMNQRDYADSAVCGACIAAEGPRGSVTVRIVDRCPECAPGDVDFSAEAFAEIADPVAGRVPISWTYVPCDVDGPVRYHLKDGSSQYWVAIQVRNHRHAIASLEASTDDGWQSLPRESYNYFIADGGLGEGPLSLRVTDIHGQTIEDSVALGDNVERTGDGQLAACR